MNWLRLGILAIGLFAYTSAFTYGAEFEKGVKSFEVTALDEMDPYEPLTFHNGNLWVGINRKDGNIWYELQAYSADGKTKIASAKVPHTVGFLYPFDEKRVITVGKLYTEPDGWLTYFTTAQLVGSHIVTKTTTLPMEVQTEHFAGNANQLYFTEVGSRKIFQYKGGVKWLSPEISGPGWMKLIGKYLFVLERKSFHPGDENLVRIDLSTQKAERVFPADRNHLTHMTELVGTPWIAITESGAGKVHLVNVSTNQVDRTISDIETPVPVGQLGHCLTVVSYFDKQLHFFDLKDKDLKEIATWDLSSVGEGYKDFRSLAVDTANGNFYVRANYRPEFPKAKTGILGFEQPDRSTFRKCN